MRLFGMYSKKFTSSRHFVDRIDNKVGFGFHLKLPNGKLAAANVSRVTCTCGFRFVTYTSVAERMLKKGEVIQHE